MATNERTEKLMEMTNEFQQMVDEYFSIQCRYQAAIQEVTTKLQILDSEFSLRYKRNPIHSMQSRMKTIQSIVEKLKRKGEPITTASAVEHLTDIAGIRVICSYIDDIYLIANLLMEQDNIRVIRVRDYIRSPKPNGYRSLHMVIEVPVYLSEGKLQVPVEVQIRTIAMDFWASLEHSIRYKAEGTVPDGVAAELLSVATDIDGLDNRMLAIRKRVDGMQGAAERQKESNRT